MNADIVEIGERLAEVFTDTLAESGLDLTVGFTFLIRDVLNKVVGRKVYVFPLGYNPFAPSSRRDDNTFDVHLSIIVFERWEDANDTGNDWYQWLKDLVYWVQEKIFNPLANTENPLQFSVIYGSNGDAGEYWAQEAAVTEVCNEDKLRDFKLFWSELEVTLRRIK